MLAVIFIVFEMSSLHSC